MKRSLMKFTLIFAAAVAACNTQEEEEAPGQAVSETGTQAAPGGAAGDPSVAHHPEPPARPAEKQDSVQIEGTWAPFTATLVKPTTDLPFSTYLPKGMIFDQASSGEGEGFYFYSAFDGRKNEDAFMLVFLLPRGASQADAQRMADAFTKSRTKPQHVARAELGSYQDRHFYVARSYPAEFGDGLGPRTHYIRKEWVWLTDGKSLESTLRPQP